MFESSSIVIVDAVAGEGGEKCMGSNTHATKHHEETKTVEDHFWCFWCICHDDDDFKRLSWLSLSSFPSSRCNDRSPKFCRVLRVLWLESFIAFFVFISTLSEEGEEDFATKKNRLLLPIISGSIFSSIPYRIPRNNERNRRRKRRRVTSPFVLYSYQTVYCVSTIYILKKVCRKYAEGMQSKSLTLPYS